MGRGLRAVVDALLPPACPLCDGAAGTRDWSWLCPICVTRIHPLTPPQCGRCWAPLGTGGQPRPGEISDCTSCERWPPWVTSARSATALEGPARMLVHRLKYHGWGGLARVMARRMTPLLPTDRVDWLVPVPTTFGRRRLRGYNPAMRIAQEVSLLSHIPVLDALARRPFGRTQLALQPNQRLANVQRAFFLSVAGDSSVQDAHVVLVDDVLTTGSTMSAAGGVLRAAGVGSISVLTFARALPARRALS